MVNASLADLRTGSLVELIGSNEIAPGAGAAGAVALALGAACAAKAAAVSLRHSLDDTRPSLALTHLGKLRDCALQGADTDARTFADYIRHRTAEGARELTEKGEAMAHLIGALLLVIEEVERFVRPSMTGDLTAAKALATAARTIQTANEAEAKAEERTIAAHPSTRA